MTVGWSWKNEPSHDKTNKMTVRPAKTQTSLGIRPVWSESSLSAWRNSLERCPDWSESSLVHWPYCWFCRAVAQISLEKFSPSLIQMSTCQYSNTLESKFCQIVLLSYKRLYFKSIILFMYICKLIFFQHYTLSLKVLKTKRVTFERRSSLPVVLPTIRTRPSLPSSNCACQLTPEPQTPLPLLENEYRNGFDSNSNYDDNIRRVSAP